MNTVAVRETDRGRGADRRDFFLLLNGKANKKGSLIWRINEASVSVDNVRLEQGHHGFSRTRLDTRACFNVQLSNDAIVDEYGIALTAHPHTKTCRV